MESKTEIYQRLEECRRLIRDPKVEADIYNQAWHEADRLLDFLNDLNALQATITVEELTV